MEASCKQAKNTGAPGPSSSVEPRKSAANVVSLKRRMSTEGQELPIRKQSQAKLQDVAGGVVASQQPRESVVDLEVGPEKDVYDYALDRYARKTGSFMSKTEISYIPVPEPEKTCFQRNLPGIIMVILVGVIAGMIVLYVTRAPSNDLRLGYLTRGTVTSTRDDNYTGVVGVNIQDILEEQQGHRNVSTGDARWGTTEDEYATNGEAAIDESSK